MLSPGRFDFAVMDGNHDATYLRKETEIVMSILRPGGVLILDDLDDNWAGIKAEYVALSSRGWRPIGADGRMGILQAAAL
jgi:predicted O-methyltransferase YrrM